MGDTWLKKARQEPPLQGFSELLLAVHIGTDREYTVWCRLSSRALCPLCPTGPSCNMPPARNKRERFPSGRWWIMYPGVCPRRGDNQGDPVSREERNYPRWWGEGYSWIWGRKMCHSGQCSIDGQTLPQHPGSAKPQRPYGVKVHHNPGCDYCST